MMDFMFNQFSDPVKQQTKGEGLNVNEIDLSVGLTIQEVL